MSTIRELHDEAMKFARESMVARAEGDFDRSRRCAASALIPERIAADMIRNSPGSEPTRSTMYLSAASLAFQAGDDEAALDLVEKGKAGAPSRQTIRDFDAIVALVQKRRDETPTGPAAAPLP